MRYGNGKNTVDGIDHNRNWKEGHREVGQSKNALGLYDMSGGVWEWVQDVYTANYSNVGTNNPIYTGSGDYRVYRGGGWYNDPWNVRCADRRRYSPADSDYNLGFRLGGVPHSR